MWLTSTVPRLIASKVAPVQRKKHVVYVDWIRATNLSVETESLAKF